MIGRIGSIFNYLAAIGLLFFGIIYLTKSSFMTYHSQAVSLGWNEIEKSIQFLILALMKTIGGGFIASSVAIIILQYKFSADRLPWIPLFLLITGIITYGASLYAQFILRMNTAGKPPTALSILMIFFIFAGYFLNRRELLNN
jgi:hypothetical protein